jgi:hypothetical protein
MAQRITFYEDKECTKPIEPPFTTLSGVSEVGMYAVFKEAMELFQAGLIDDAREKLHSLLGTRSYEVIELMQRYTSANGHVTWILQSISKEEDHE